MPGDRYSRLKNRSAMTFAELMVVVLIVSFFVLMAYMNLSGLLRKNIFKAQVHELISLMQMAARGAAESDRKYEMIIDITEQKYILREITSSNLSEVLEEEIIAENDFGKNCRVSYVLFDDSQYTNEGKAKFRAGLSGWQYGGIIVLLDQEQEPYSIVVNRLGGTVTLEQGEAKVPEPKFKDDVPF